MDELVHDMFSAAENDVNSLLDGKPGIAKLSLLSKVEDLTSKQTLQDSFIDAGGLKAIREWLRLLPDSSLPNLSLRTSLLGVILKVVPSISIENLRESQVGFAIRDIIFHEDETPSNKRIANEIAEHWLRLIFGRESRHVSVKATDEEMSTAVNHLRTSYRSRAVLPQEKEDSSKRFIRRPSVSGGTFRVQPVSHVDPIEQTATGNRDRGEARKRGSGSDGLTANERIAKALQNRRLHSGKNSGAKVSVEGRGL